MTCHLDQTRVEKNTRVKHAQAWAVQGWVRRTPGLRVLNLEQSKGGEESTHTG